MCGGHSAPKDVEDTEDGNELKEIVAGLKSKVEEKLEKTFGTFTPIKYTTQVVAGIIYQVKVDVGDNKYVHAKIVKPLPHTGNPPELMEAQGDKAMDDAF